jgi:hypothetical protein
MSMNEREITYRPGAAQAPTDGTSLAGIALAEVQASAVWLLQNAIRPAENAGIVQPYNAVANAVNGASQLTCHIDILPKAKVAPVQEAPLFSSAWFAQNISTGLASAVVYGMAGGVASRTLGESIGARTAQIVGAVIYDGLRDNSPGETRIGNAVSGAIAFCVFEGGNSYFAPGSNLNQLLGRATIGSLGATSGLIISQAISKRDVPAWSEVLHAATTGATMNMVLPKVQERIYGGISSTERLRVGNRATVQFENSSEVLPCDDYHRILVPNIGKTREVNTISRRDVYDLAAREHFGSANDSKGTTQSEADHLDLPDSHPKFIQLAEFLSAPFKSSRSFIRLRREMLNGDAMPSKLEEAAHEIDKPVNVYTHTKFPNIRIEISQEYDKELDELRNHLRVAQMDEEGLSAEQKAQKAEALNVLKTHPLKDRVLPEDIAWSLNYLPQPSLVSRVILEDQQRASDLWYQATTGTDPGTAAVSSVSGEITVYPQLSDIPIADRTELSSLIRLLISHEWSHLLKWRLPRQSALFDQAARIERGGYMADGYAVRVDTNDENWAVNLGEGLLHPEQCRFLEVTEKAPVRCLALAQALKQCFAGPDGSQMMRMALGERMKYLDEETSPRAKLALVHLMEEADPVLSRVAGQLLIRSNGYRYLGLVRQIDNLDLRYSNGADQAVEHLNPTCRVRNLELMYSDVTDTGLLKLSCHQNLQSLSLVGTRITGLQFCDNLLDLQKLNLANTAVGDSDLRHLLRLQALTELRLENTNVTDQSIGTLMRLHHLRTLALSGSRLTLQALKALRSALPDCHVIHELV